MKSHHRTEDDNRDNNRCLWILDVITYVDFCKKPFRITLSSGLNIISYFLEIQYQSVQIPKHHSELAPMI